MKMKSKQNPDSGVNRGRLAIFQATFRPSPATTRSPFWGNCYDVPDFASGVVLRRRSTDLGSRHTIPASRHFRISIFESSQLSDDLRWKYDVFVSFEGEETRRDFVSHLLRAFKQKSISTFVDAEDNCRVDRHSEELRKPVQQSRILIVVFSENYASSRWCLRELVQMEEQVKMTAQVLVPVFYGVDPSEVRKATGAFREAFERYVRKMEPEMYDWRDALTAATDYFGWHIRDYRDDAELIEEIVQWAFNKLIRWSSFEGGWKYDVFLNFRGEDTRKSFTSHLYKALYQKVINTFMDDEELRKGNSLSGLLKCIKQSRVSIVVFSADYASSTWCLKELVQILKCMDEQNQIVVPVFYEVDPSQVCKPEAFTKHDRDSKVEKEEVQSWMSALTRATNLTLPRWDSRNYEDDSKLIEAIVQHISSELPRLPYRRWATFDNDSVEIEDDSDEIQAWLQINPS